MKRETLEETIERAKREGDAFKLGPKSTELGARKADAESTPEELQLAGLESILLDRAAGHPLTAEQLDALVEFAKQSVLKGTPGRPKGPRDAGNAFRQCAAILMDIGCGEYRTAPRQHIQKQTRKRIAQRAIEVLLQDPPGGQITVDTVLLDAGLRDEDLLDAGLRDKALLDLVVDFKGRITEQAREYVDRHFPNAWELMRDLPPESYRAGDRVYKAAK